MRSLLLPFSALILTLLIASGTQPARAASHSHHSSRTHRESHHRCATCKRDRHGHIQRSRQSRSAFEHSHPCPATGKTKGRCAGYVVDHVVPLECGGTDAPSNMQWQTKSAAKAKDKAENGCKK